MEFHMHVHIFALGHEFILFIEKLAHLSMYLSFEVVPIHACCMYIMFMKVGLKLVFN